MAQLWTILSVVGVAAAWASGAGPVQKVIELLEENKMKVLHDLAAEEKEMAAYAQFCDDESTEKQHAIKDAEREISELQAAVEDGMSQIGQFESEIEATGRELAEKDR